MFRMWTVCEIPSGSTNVSAEALRSSLSISVVFIEGLLATIPAAELKVDGLRWEALNK